MHQRGVHTVTYLQGRKLSGPPRTQDYSTPGLLLLFACPDVFNIHIINRMTYPSWYRNCSSLSALGHSRTSSLWLIMDSWPDTMGRN